jgi:SAM-dependent methyltransferase
MLDDPFARFAMEYDEWFERNPWAYRSELAALAKVVPEGRGVDIGSGTGRFSSPFNIYVGVDPSMPMLRLAGGKGLRIVQGRAESLPFRDGAFDFALMVTVLCFVNDRLAALREAVRVVRRGGSILVGILDRDSPLGRRYEAGAEGSRFYRDARFLSAAEAFDLLEQAGCTVESTFHTIFSDPRGLKAPEPVLEGHGNGLFTVISARV